MSKQLPTGVHKLTREALLSKNPRGFFYRHPNFNVLFDNEFANYFKYKLTHKDKSATFSSMNGSIGIKDDGMIEIHFPLTKKQKEEYHKTSHYERSKDGYDGIDWDSNHVTTTIDDFLEHATVELKGIDKWNDYCDVLQVGDFVQFTGQRDTRSWRKIIRLDWDRNSIFGHKYNAPIDDEKYDARHSSENMITTIKSWKPNK